MNTFRRRLYQLGLVSKLFIAWVITRFIGKQDFWLLSERGREARDNTYAFYRWLKQNHPEQRIKYVINSESPDINRIDPADRVEFNSMSHYISIWQAKCLISTHIMGYTPDLVFFARLDKQHKLFGKQTKVFLQHGITKDRIEGLFYNSGIHIDLFISGSQKEYDYLCREFGYPQGVIQYTGLCRFDNLMGFVSKRQILIMPTFRMYIDRNKFEDSDYYKAYRDLLCSSVFHSFLEEAGYTAIFYPHFEFQSKIGLFKKLNLPECITVADISYDVQSLLKESEILITDFSSVFFDMMYMHKPILFYQFDESIYRAHHYKQGYLNYRDVGHVANDLTELLSNLKNVLSSSNPIAKYQEYYNATYKLRDRNNCFRVYDAIKSIENK